MTVLIFPDLKKYLFVKILSSLICKVSLVLVHRLTRSCAYKKYGQMDVQGDYYISPNKCVCGGVSVSILVLF